MTGADLRALRQGAGLKAGQIARVLGYSASQWSAYENDRAPIPPVVEYATKWVCRRDQSSSKGEALIAAIKDAIQ